MKPVRSLAFSVNRSCVNFCSKSSSPVKTVSKDTLIDLMKKPTFILLDVRRPEEVQYGMIPTACNIPLDQLENALKLDNQEFKKKYGIRKPNKDDKMIIYCHSGFRSHSACELALAVGFKDVSNYKGSWSEWSR